MKYYSSTKSTKSILELISIYKTVNYYKLQRKLFFHQISFAVAQLRLVDVAKARHLAIFPDKPSLWCRKQPPLWTSDKTLLSEILPRFQNKLLLTAQ